MIDVRTIQITNNYPKLHFAKQDLLHMFSELDAYMGLKIPDGELTIVFVDDDTISRVHDTFMQDPTPTDVITFQGDADMDFAGEIVVSVDHALKCSKELNLPFVQELTLYLVHGWLHLAGLDDLVDEELAKMEAAEKALMDYLQQKNAIPDFSIIG